MKSGRIFLNYILIIIAFLGILSLFFMFYFSVYHSDKISNEEDDNQKSTLSIKTTTTNEKVNMINQKKQELDQFIKENYNASVSYYDIKFGISYNYKEKEEMFGASLIKLVVAMYYIEEGTKGNINLNDTLEYRKEHLYEYSKKLSKHEYGDQIKIIDLLKYAVTYSDNSAHIMLIQNVGRKKIREYGLSLGGKYILNGSSNYGNQSAEDMMVYLKHAYNIIENNKEYGNVLKSWMMNTWVNSLNFSKKNNVAHKYGKTGEFGHDVGIVYDEDNYLIVIMTHEGKNGYQSIIKKIHKKIYELHELIKEYND